MNTRSQVCQDFPQVAFCAARQVSERERRRVFQLLAALAPQARVLTLGPAVCSQIPDTYRRGRPGTIHLVLSAPAGSLRLPVLFRTCRFTFIGLDTAFFAPLLAREAVLEAVALTPPSLAGQLDLLLVRAAAALCRGASLQELGTPTHLKALQEAFWHRVVSGGGCAR